MNKINMNFNNYQNYSTNLKKLKNDNTTETPIKTEPTQITNTPAFKGGTKINKNSIKIAFTTLVGALGLSTIIKSKKTEDKTIIKEPKIGENVDKKEAEILLKCWNNKNDGIKSINTISGRDRDGLYHYTLVEFNNGKKVTAPFIDTEENLIKMFKEFVLYNPNNTFSESLSELYNKSIDDYTTKIEQPKTPVVLDKNDFTTKPNDEDKFFDSNLGYKRSDAARILRFGENSLINNDKTVLNNIKYYLKSTLDIKEPNLFDVRAIKRFGDNNDTYIYYDKKTNLTSIFDDDGTLKGQVAFNTNYQTRGDEIPTDYKFYSFYANEHLREFN